MSQLSHSGLILTQTAPNTTRPRAPLLGFAISKTTRDILKLSGKRGFHGTLGTMAKSATDTCSKLLEITRDN